MNFDLLQLCHEKGVGVMQMPCPEVLALGVKRKRPPGTTIRQALDSEAGWRNCADLAASVAERIEAAMAEGSRLVAVLSGNPRSPGCAVHDERGVLLESGGFMRELQRELRLRGIDVPFRGMREASPEMLADDLHWFRNLLATKLD